MADEPEAQTALAPAETPSDSGTTPSLQQAEAPPVEGQEATVAEETAEAGGDTFKARLVELLKDPEILGAATSSLAKEAVAELPVVKELLKAERTSTRQQEKHFQEERAKQAQAGAGANIARQQAAAIIGQYLTDAAEGKEVRFDAARDQLVEYTNQEVAYRQYSQNEAFFGHLEKQPWFEGIPEGERRGLILAADLPKLFDRAVEAAVDARKDEYVAEGRKLERGEIKKEGLVAEMQKAATERQETAPALGKGSAGGGSDQERLDRLAAGAPTSEDKEWYRQRYGRQRTPA